MRKIFYIFILMVSSFFVFNIKVSASTYNRTIPENDFTYFDDNFLKLREKTIEYCKENNKSYVIGLRYSYVFDYNSYRSDMVNGDPFIDFNTTAIIFKLVEGELSQLSTSSDFTVYFSLSDAFTYKYFLDTNIEELKNTTSHTWNFTYLDSTYTVNPNDRFPTLYEIYEDIYGSIEPEEPEELPRNESLDSFYALILEKIELFANYFITNITLLFIIGIIILIFIIELIFRRYL